MKMMISACLLGACCRYDGGTKEHPDIARLAQQHTLIPVCPEQLGGLPTPRPPAERQGAFVRTQAGKDVTEQYTRGAREALRLYRLLDCDAAVLKERSPSCGRDTIYDGTFTGTLTPGDGVTAALFRENGIRVYGESGIGKLLK